MLHVHIILFFFFFHIQYTPCVDDVALILGCFAFVFSTCAFALVFIYSPTWKRARRHLTRQEISALSLVSRSCRGRGKGEKKSLIQKLIVKLVIEMEDATASSYKRQLYITGALIQAASIGKNSVRKEQTGRGAKEQPLRESKEPISASDGQAAKEREKHIHLTVGRSRGANSGRQAAGVFFGDTTAEGIRNAEHTTRDERGAMLVSPWYERRRRARKYFAIDRSLSEGRAARVEEVCRGGGAAQRHHHTCTAGMLIPKSIYEQNEEQCKTDGGRKGTKINNEGSYKVRVANKIISDALHPAADLCDLDKAKPMGRLDVPSFVQRTLIDAIDYRRRFEEWKGTVEAQQTLDREAYQKQKMDRKKQQKENRKDGGKSTRKGVLRGTKGGGQSTSGTPQNLSFAGAAQLASTLIIEPIKRALSSAASQREREIRNGSGGGGGGGGSTILYSSDRPTRTPHTSPTTIRHHQSVCEASGSGRESPQDPSAQTSPEKRGNRDRSSSLRMLSSIINFARSTKSTPVKKQPWHQHAGMLPSPHPGGLSSRDAAGASDEEGDHNPIPRTFYTSHTATCTPDSSPEGKVTHNSQQLFRSTSATQTKSAAQRYSNPSPVNTHSHTKERATMYGEKDEGILSNFREQTIVFEDSCDKEHDERTSTPSSVNLRKHFSNSCGESETAVSVPVGAQEVEEPTQLDSRHAFSLTASGSLVALAKVTDEIDGDNNHNSSRTPLLSEVGKDRTFSRDERGRRDGYEQMSCGESRSLFSYSASVAANSVSQNEKHRDGNEETALSSSSGTDDDTDDDSTDYAFIKPASPAPVPSLEAEIGDFLLEHAEVILPFLAIPRHVLSSSVSIGPKLSTFGSFGPSGGGGDNKNNSSDHAQKTAKVSMTTPAPTSSSPVFGGATKSGVSAAKEEREESMKKEVSPSSLLFPSNNEPLLAPLPFSLSTSPRRRLGPSSRPLSPMLEGIQTRCLFETPLWREPAVVVPPQTLQLLVNLRNPAAIPISFLKAHGSKAFDWSRVAKFAAVPLSSVGLSEAVMYQCILEIRHTSMAKRSKGKSLGFGRLESSPSNASPSSARFFRAREVLPSTASSNSPPHGRKKLLEKQGSFKRGGGDAGGRSEVPASPSNKAAATSENPRKKYLQEKIRKIPSSRRDLEEALRKDRQKLIDIERQAVIRENSSAKRHSLHPGALSSSGKTKPPLEILSKLVGKIRCTILRRHPKGGGITEERDTIAGSASPLLSSHKQKNQTKYGGVDGTSPTMGIDKNKTSDQHIRRGKEAMADCALLLGSSPGAERLNMFSFASSTTDVSEDGALKKRDKPKRTKQTKDRPSTQSNSSVICASLSSSSSTHCSQKISSDDHPSFPSSSSSNEPTELSSSDDDMPVPLHAYRGPIAGNTMAIRNHISPLLPLHTENKKQPSPPSLPSYMYSAGSLTHSPAKKMSLSGKIEGWEKKGEREEAFDPIRFYIDTSFPFVFSLAATRSPHEQQQQHSGKNNHNHHNKNIKESAPPDSSILPQFLSRRFTEKAGGGGRAEQISNQHSLGRYDLNTTANENNTIVRKTATEGVDSANKRLNSQQKTIAQSLTKRIKSISDIFASPTQSNANVQRAFPTVETIRRGKGGEEERLHQHHPEFTQNLEAPRSQIHVANFQASDSPPLPPAQPNSRGPPVPVEDVCYCNTSFLAPFAAANMNEREQHFSTAANAGDLGPHMRGAPPHHLVSHSRNIIAASSSPCIFTTAVNANAADLRSANALNHGAAANATFNHHRRTNSSALPFLMGSSTKHVANQQSGTQTKQATAPTGSRTSPMTTQLSKREREKIMKYQAALLERDLNEARERRRRWRRTQVYRLHRRPPPPPLMLVMKYYNTEWVESPNMLIRFTRHVTATTAEVFALHELRFYELIAPLFAENSLYFSPHQLVQERERAEEEREKERRADTERRRRKTKLSAVHQAQEQERWRAWRAHKINNNRCKDLFNEQSGEGPVATSAEEQRPRNNIRIEEHGVGAADPYLSSYLLRRVPTFVEDDGFGTIAVGCGGANPKDTMRRRRVEAAEAWKEAEHGDGPDIDGSNEVMRVTHAAGDDRVNLTDAATTIKSPPTRRGTNYTHIHYNKNYVPDESFFSVLSSGQSSPYFSASIADASLTMPPDTRGQGGQGQAQKTIICRIDPQQSTMSKANTTRRVSLGSPKAAGLPQDPSEKGKCLVLGKGPQLERNPLSFTSPTGAPRPQPHQQEDCYESTALVLAANDKRERYPHDIVYGLLSNSTTDDMTTTTRYHPLRTDTMPQYDPALLSSSSMPLPLAAMTRGVLSSNERRESSLSVQKRYGGGLDHQSIRTCSSIRHGEGSSISSSGSEGRGGGPSFRPRHSNVLHRTIAKLIRNARGLLGQRNLIGLGSSGQDNQKRKQAEGPEQPQPVTFSSESDMLGHLRPGGHPHLKNLRQQARAYEHYRLGRKRTEEDMKTREAVNQKNPCQATPAALRPPRMADPSVESPRSPPPPFQRTAEKSVVFAEGNTTAVATAVADDEILMPSSPLRRTSGVGVMVDDVFGNDRQLFSFDPAEDTAVLGEEGNQTSNDKVDEQIASSSQYPSRLVEFTLGQHMQEETMCVAGCGGAPLPLRLSTAPPIGMVSLHQSNPYSSAQLVNKRSSANPRRLPRRYDYVSHREGNLRCPFRVPQVYFLGAYNKGLPSLLRYVCCAEGSGSVVAIGLEDMKHAGYSFEHASAEGVGTSSSGQNPHLSTPFGASNNVNSPAAFGFGVGTAVGGGLESTATLQEREKEKKAHALGGLAHPVYKSVVRTEGLKIQGEAARELQTKHDDFFWRDTRLFKSPLRQDAAGLRSERLICAVIRGLAYLHSVTWGRCDEPVLRTELGEAMIPRLIHRAVDDDYEESNISPHSSPTTGGGDGDALGGQKSAARDHYDDEADSALSPNRHQRHGPRESTMATSLLRIGFGKSLKSIQNVRAQLEKWYSYRPADVLLMPEVQNSIMFIQDRWDEVRAEAQRIVTSREALIHGDAHYKNCGFKALPLGVKVFGRCLDDDFKDDEDCDYYDGDGDYDYFVAPQMGKNKTIAGYRTTEKGLQLATEKQRTTDCPDSHSDGNANNTMTKVAPYPEASSADVSAKSQCGSCASTASFRAEAVEPDTGKNHNQKKTHETHDANRNSTPLFVSNNDRGGVDEKRSSWNVPPLLSPPRRSLEVSSSECSSSSDDTNEEEEDCGLSSLFLREKDRKRKFTRSVSLGPANPLRQYDDEESMLQACFLDFQGCGGGSVAAELLYFICTSCPVEVEEERIIAPTLEEWKNHTNSKTMGRSSAAATAAPGRNKKGVVTNQSNDNNKNKLYAPMNVDGKGGGGRASLLNCSYTTNSNQAPLLMYVSSRSDAARLSTLSNTADITPPPSSCGAQRTSIANTMNGLTCYDEVTPTAPFHGEGKEVCVRPASSWQILYSQMNNLITKSGSPCHYSVSHKFYHQRQNPLRLPPLGTLKLRVTLLQYHLKREIVGNGDRGDTHTYGDSQSTAAGNRDQRKDPNRRSSRDRQIPPTSQAAPPSTPPPVGYTMTGGATQVLSDYYRFLSQSSSLAGPTNTKDEGDKMGSFFPEGQCTDHHFNHHHDTCGKEICRHRKEEVEVVLGGSDHPQGDDEGVRRNDKDLFNHSHQDDRAHDVVRSTPSTQRTATPTSATAFGKSIFSTSRSRTPFANPPSPKHATTARGALDHSSTALVSVGAVFHRTALSLEGGASCEDSILGDTKRRKIPNGRNKRKEIRGKQHQKMEDTVFVSPVVAVGSVQQSSRSYGVASIGICQEEGGVTLDDQQHTGSRRSQQSAAGALHEGITRGSTVESSLGPTTPQQLMTREALPPPSLSLRPHELPDDDGITKSKLDIVGNYYAMRPKEKMVSVVAHNTDCDIVLQLEPTAQMMDEAEKSRHRCVISHNTTTDRYDHDLHHPLSYAPEILVQKDHHLSLEAPLHPRHQQHNSREASSTCEEEQPTTTPQNTSATEQRDLDGEEEEHNTNNNNNQKQQQNRKRLLTLEELFAYDNAIIDYYYQRLMDGPKIGYVPSTASVFARSPFVGEEEALGRTATPQNVSSSCDDEEKLAEARGPSRARHPMTRDRLMREVYILARHWAGCLMFDLAATKPSDRHRMKKVKAFRDMIEWSERTSRRVLLMAASCYAAVDRHVEVFDRNAQEIKDAVERIVECKARSIAHLANGEKDRRKH